MIWTVSMELTAALAFLAAAFAAFAAAAFAFFWKQGNE